MSGNAPLSTIDVDQLVQKVRSEIQRREAPSHSRAATPEQAAQLIASVKSVTDELDALQSRIEIGEPQPGSVTLRGRLGSFFKNRLHRLLWWQSYQTKALTTLVARQNRLLSDTILLAQENEARRTSKEAVAEVQQHIARLEYSKANRTELAAQYDALLAAKAERQEISDVAGQFAVKNQQLEQALSGLAAQVNSTSTAVEDRLKGCESSRVEPTQVAGLGRDVLTLNRQMSAMRLDLQDFHRRLGVFLEQAKKRMPEPFTSDQIQEMSVKGQDFMDSLYVAFEDRFRGSFEAVRDGIKVYLPLVKQALERTGEAPLLDVACGRGEWLDFLREQGIPATGVDLNSTAIELCRENSLNVTQEDAFEYLRKQPKNSCSAITSFHFIEHLDYRSWISLLDESLRILKPGGVAIFETPNARNILGTAGDFYRDPTHSHPIFPDTIEAIAEMRGFFDSKAYFFNEGRTELIPIKDYSFARLEDYVTVSRDAVWVGIKAA